MDIEKRIAQAVERGTGVRLTPEETRRILFRYIEAINYIDSGCDGCVRDNGEKDRSDYPCCDCSRNYGDRKDESEVDED